MMNGVMLSTIKAAELVYVHVRCWIIGTPDNLVVKTHPVTWWHVCVHCWLVVEVLSRP